MDSCYNLSKNEETEGFDLEGGKTWIYPTNMPLRDYQFNIIQQALLKNTLVCLPTGLGKTFIAAVVMYNFFRWYPNGKIIFMAPTKPLVNQQIDACYNIVAIPKHATAELTGSTIQTNRDDIWNEKRVFFITPQVLQNDLERISKLGKQIKCLVFDEAHKARGNQAYCEVMRQLCPVNKYFRVLALSATPGNSVVDVVNVCQSLLISHIEVRTEDSLDVRPYVFKRTVSTVVVPFDAKLKQIYADYIKVLDRYVRVLINHKVVHGNCSMLTKGRLFFVMKEFEEKNKHNRGSSYNEIMKNLNICVILYHAFEVLTKHGLRGFLTFFQEHVDKPLLRHNNDILEIMEDITQYLGPIPVVDMLPDGSIPEIPETTKFGHPKYYKLSEIILSHFQSKGEESKVIVFCEFRESVMEAYTILLKNKGKIKPKIFLGQGAMTQKQQILVIESFRKGIYNTLVSTSIGEEGLDVGEVDLVVCFDISNKSSIRMIQRMGRTGRKREGKVVMLVTEGKEQQLLKECLAQKDCIANTIAKSKELMDTLYKHNPRMVPQCISPTCDKMFITVVKPKGKLKNKDLLSMFNKMGDNLIDADDKRENFTNRIPACNMELENNFEEIQNIDYSKYLSKQTVLQCIYGCISSTENSKLLVSLLQIADSKRYNIPLTQSSTSSNPKLENFIQSDIRTMFKKQSSSLQCSQTNKEPELIQPTENKKVLELNAEINYIINAVALNSICKFCDNLFTCDSRNFKTSTLKIDSWGPPDTSILDFLTIENLTRMHIPSNNNTEIQQFDEFDEFDDILTNFEGNELSQIENKHVPLITTNKNINTNNQEINFENGRNDLDIEMKLLEKSKSNSADSVKTEEKSMYENNSISYINAEMSCSENIYEWEISAVASPPTKTTVKSGVLFTMPKNAEKILKLHNDCPNTQEIEIPKKTTFSYNEHECKDTLIFFKLNKLEDLYVATTDLNNSYDSDATIIYSPNEYISTGIGKTKFALNDVKSPKIASDDSESPKNERSPIISTNNSKNSCKPIITLNNLESPIISSFDQRTKIHKGQKRLFSELSPVQNVPNKAAKILDDIDIFDNDFLHFAMNKPIEVPQENRIRGHSPDIFGSYSSAGSKNPSANLEDFMIEDRFPTKKSPHKEERTQTNTAKNVRNECENFELEINSNPKKSPVKCFTEKKTDKNLRIDDICDNSILDFVTGNKIDENNVNVSKNLFFGGNKEQLRQSEITSNMIETLPKNVTINDICDTSILDIFADVENQPKPKCIVKASNNSNFIKNNKNITFINTSQKENQCMQKKSNLTKNILQENSLSICDDLEWNDDDDFEESFSKIKKTESADHSKSHRITHKKEISEYVKAINNTPKSNNSQSQKSDDVRAYSPVISNSKVQHERKSQKKTFKAEGSFDSLESEEDDIFFLSPINIPVNENRQKNDETQNFKCQQVFTISSDEFDESPIKPKKPNLTKLNKRKLPDNKHFQKYKSDSSDDFEESPIKSKTSRTKKKSTKKIDNPFFDMEAQLSSGEEVSEDEEGGSSQDMLEFSFVNDETENFANTTNMHLHYIQSVKSPANRGKFKIPQLPKQIDREIYSQPVDESEENSYENDSFCVNTTIDLTQDLSELEIAEMILKQKRRNKKKGNDKSVPKSKRRRIIIASDDSD